MQEFGESNCIAPGPALALAAMNRAAEAIALRLAPARKQAGRILRETAAPPEAA